MMKRCQTAYATTLERLLYCYVSPDDNDLIATNSSNSSSREMLSTGIVVGGLVG